jgi:hypothetical protein
MVDKNYWASDLPLPLSPSDDDVKEFKSHMKKGTTLLLGCTKKLIPLSDRQLDIDPWYNGETVIVGNWLENKHFYTNILLDGGFNILSKEMCNSLLSLASKCCEVLIVRSFDKKLPTMRIADNFPIKEDFDITPTEIITCKDYSFFIWEF